MAPPLRRRTLATLGALIAASLSACAATGPATDEASAGPGASDPLATLQRDLRAESRRPDRRATEAPVPPGVDADDVAPLTGEALALARTPADAALEAVAGAFPEPNPPVASDRDEATLSRALELYLNGRMARLGGSPEQALETLEQSARLNPDPAETWREIGLAHLDAGNRLAAATAFRRAFDRDPDNLEILEHIATTAALDRADRRAAAVLARLRAAPEDRLDPAMRYLLPASLGEALVRLGYLGAGAELLERGADLPDRFTETTARPDELAALYRRRAELFVQIGDARLRLGDTPGALGAYRRAAALPSLRPSLAAGRVVHALMLLGRPTEAGAEVLARVAAAGGVADEASVGLLRHIAAHSDAGPALSDALGEIERSLPPERRAVARTALLRLRAAIADRAEATRLLAESLDSGRATPALFDQMVGPGLSADDAFAFDLAASLAGARPRYSEAIADALMRRFDAAPAAADAWVAWAGGRRATPETRRLGSRLLGEAGRRAEAVEALLPITTGGGRADPDALALLVLHAQVLGDGELAGEAIELLGEPADVAGALRLALAHLRRIDRDSAMDALAPFADPAIEPAPGDRVDTSTALATTATMLRADGDARGAERLLRRAIELDPTNEDAHAGFIELVLPGRPLADPDAVSERLSALRDAAPESDSLAFFRARESLALGQREQARRELLELLDRSRAHATAAEMLVSLWIRDRAWPPARVWLREWIDERPGNDMPVRLLANVERQAGNPELAVELLRDRVSANPGEYGVSRQLENLLRDPRRDEGSKREADRLNGARLALIPPSTERAMQEAEFAVRTARPDDAARAIAEAFRRADKRGRDMVQWANRLAVFIGSVVEDLAFDPRDAARLTAMARDGVPRPAWSTHAVHLGLLARLDVGKERLIEAAEDAGADHPDLAVDAYLVLVDVLARGVLLDKLYDNGLRRGAGHRPPDAQRLERRRLGARVAAAALPSLDRERSASLVAAGLLLAVDGFRNGREDRDAATLLEVSEWVFGAGTEIEIADELQRMGRARDADLCADLGVLAHEAGSDELSNRFYRLTLRIDHAHRMANNNLGYRLLTLDRDIDEAAAMIEKAYNRGRDEAHIVDSMGWARYKQGLIHDVRDEQGVVVAAGAVTLLRRAVGMIRNSRQEGMWVQLPVVLDHLGDALWAAGLAEEAVEAWEEASGVAANATRPEVIAENEWMTSSLIEEMRGVAEGAASKARAVAEDREPPVSRVHGPVNDPETGARRASPEAAR